MGVMHACTYPGCKKQFDRKYNLKCHLRIHSNEKPYRCHHAHCTRSFRWKSSLNHHLMSLDHTPVAARRERKARAAKRRQEQLAADAAAAAAALAATHALQLPLLANTQPSPTAAVHDRHHHPLSFPSPNLQQQQQQHPHHLPDALPLDLSDVSLSPAPDPHPHPYQHQNTHPQLIPKHHQHLYLSTAAAAAPPYSPASLSALADTLSYEAVTRRSAWHPTPTHPARNPQELHMAVHPPDHPTQHVVAQQQHDDIPHQHITDSAAHSAASQRGADVAAAYMAQDHPVSVAKAALPGHLAYQQHQSQQTQQHHQHHHYQQQQQHQQQQMTPVDQKLSAPIEALFEDSSPMSSLLTSGPSPMDSIFGAYGFDAQSLRSF